MQSYFIKTVNYVCIQTYSFFFVFLVICIYFQAATNVSGVFGIRTRKLTLANVFAVSIGKGSTTKLEVPLSSPVALLLLILQSRVIPTLSFHPVFGSSVMVMATVLTSLLQWMMIGSNGNGFFSTFQLFSIVWGKVKDAVAFATSMEARMSVKEVVFIV